MNIAKVLLPDFGVLKTTKDNHRAKILDAELDVLELDFHGSNSVEIKTDGYSYITLTMENLRTLMDLITKSESIIYNEK